MEFLKSLFELIIGLQFTADNLATVIAGGFFALVGLALNYFIKVKKGIKRSEHSPDKFSLKYFVENNYQDIVITALLIFISLRFTQELLGVELTMWIAVLIGFGIDFIQDIITDKLNKFTDTKPRNEQ